jgi:hypothetical protein
MRPHLKTISECCVLLSSYLWCEIGGLWSRPSWAKKMRHYLQNNQSKMGWRCCSHGKFSAKHEGLSSNPSTAVSLEWSLAKFLLSFSVQGLMPCMLCNSSTTENPKRFFFSFLFFVQYLSLD